MTINIKGYIVNSELLRLKPFTVKHIYLVDIFIFGTIGGKNENRQNM